MQIQPFSVKKWLEEGDTVAVGYTKLSANASGGVKTNASGTAYLVVEAGSAEKQATILL